MEIPIKFHEMSNGQIVLISMAGIHKYSGNDDWDFIEYEEGLGKLRFHSAFDLEGSLYISMGKNFGKLSGSSWNQEKLEIRGRFIIDELAIWASTNDGLIMNDGGKWTIKGAIPNVFETIQDNKGAIWALSKKDGVGRYYQGNWTIFSEKNKLPFDDAQQVSGNNFHLFNPDSS